MDERCVWMRVDGVGPSYRKSNIMKPDYNYELVNRQLFTH